MVMERLTIGQAAQAAGLTRKAIRLYESKGLLRSAARSAAGYRLYTHGDVELLTFIRRARTLGLHLDDIREVLAIRCAGTPPCARVPGMLDARVAEIDAAVADLLTLRETLTQTRQTGGREETDAAVCAIIEST